MPPIAILIALADPTRCRILEILRDGPQPVHVLASAFAISRPAISRHLRVLKQARLIGEKKSGRENRYGLHPARLKPVQAWLAEFAVTPKAAGKSALPAAAPPPRPRPALPASQMGFDF
jgi:DNA-binding transcriptional ArsR family regulator